MYFKNLLKTLTVPILISSISILAQTAEKGIDGVYRYVEKKNETELKQYERNLYKGENSNLNVNASIANSAFLKEFRVNNNEDSFGSEQSYPSATMDGNGITTIVWVDSRDGGRDIYGQRYNEKGERLGENFKINEQTKGISNGGPAIATTDEGKVLVLWDTNMQYMNAQYYDSKGEKIGQNISILNPTYVASSSPCVVATKHDEFFVAWRSDNIYLQKLWNDGNGKSAVKKLNNSQKLSGGSSGYGQTIALNEKGEVAVVWAENIDGKSKIYIQFMTSELETIGENVCLSQKEEMTEAIFPSVTALGNNNFCVAWEKRLPNSEGQDIAGQIISSNGSKIGSELKVSKNIKGKYSSYASLTSKGKDEFIIVWNNWGTEFFSSYSNDGTEIGMPQPLYLDNNASYPYWTKITSNSKGELLFTWTDNRNRLSDIAFQFYDKSLKPLGKNTFPVIDIGSAWQENPSIAVNKYGGYLVAWEDNRSGKTDIYVKTFRKNGIAYSDEIQINLNLVTDNCERPKVLADTEGNYIIAWLQYTDLFIQKISAIGKKIGEVIKLNDAHQWSAYNFNMTLDKEGYVIISWLAENSSFNGITQKIHTNDFKLYPGTKISFPNSSQDTFASSIQWAVNSRRETCVLLKYYNKSNYKSDNKLYAQIFNSKGEQVGATLTLAESMDANEIYGIIAADKSDNFLAGWINGTDYSHNSIYLQRIHRTSSLLGSTRVMNEKPDYIYDLSFLQDSQFSTIILYQAPDNIYYLKVQENLEPIGKAYPLNSSNRLYSNYQKYNFEGDNFYILTEDTRVPSTGKDIWLRITSLFEIEAPKDLPKATLFQNYPNPFNPLTAISYSLPKASTVKLRIFDLLGKEIAVLENSYKDKGVHQVTFDGTNCASGVYFFQLIADNFVETKKLLLMK